jgi:hypothetical protein
VLLCTSSFLESKDKLVNECLRMTLSSSDIASLKNYVSKNLLCYAMASFTFLCGMVGDAMLP